MLPKDSINRLVYFQREVNKLFKSVFANDSHTLAAKMESLLPLPMDVYDEGNHIIFEIETPGVDPENLSLYATNDLLILEGSKKENKREEKSNFNCMERTFGKFRRLIEIPITANLGMIKARYRDGILRVEIAKISDRRGERRLIPVEVSQ